MSSSQPPFSHVSWLAGRDIEIILSPRTESRLRPPNCVVSLSPPPLYRFVWRTYTYCHWTAGGGALFDDSPGLCVCEIVLFGATERRGWPKSLCLLANNILNFSPLLCEQRFLEIQGSTVPWTTNDCLDKAVESRSLLQIINSYIARWFCDEKVRRQWESWRAERSAVEEQTHEQTNLTLF